MLAFKYKDVVDDALNEVHYLVDDDVTRDELHVVCRGVANFYRLTIEQTNSLIRKAESEIPHSMKSGKSIFDDNEEFLVED